MRTRNALLRQRRHLRGGFSLMETLLTMVVLLVAMGGMASSVLSSVQLQERNWEMAQAHQVTREISEKLQAMDPETIFALLDGTGTTQEKSSSLTAAAKSTYADSELNGLKLAFVLGTHSETVQADEDGEGPDLLPLTIQCSWQGGSGQKTLNKTVWIKSLL